MKSLFTTLAKPAPSGLARALPHQSRCGKAAAIACTILFLFAVDRSDAAAEELAVTRGGDDGIIKEVTSLADSGPGSLRWAVNGANRKIVFKIGGEIWLKSPITIKDPAITVAGETAPSPGITLMADSLRIRGHDVIVRHIRVRIGAHRGDGAANRDGIGVDGSVSGERPAHNIIVENCSVSWAIDEGIVVYGANSNNVVFRNNIVAEGLYRSVHPKGLHSMGVMVGPDTHDIVVQGNLIAHNQWRNPVVSAGASAIVVNNLIYNPGAVGLHFYPSRPNTPGGPTRVSAVGNILIAGTDTRSTLLAFRQGLTPQSQIHYSDNVADGAVAFDTGDRPPNDTSFSFADKPPVWYSRLKILPSSDVFDYVLANAGARPNDRDETDRRIIQEVRTGTGRIRNEPADVRLRTQ